MTRLQQRSIFASALFTTCFGMTGFACHEPQHDCVVYIGPPVGQDLPFQVAIAKGLFLKENVFPEIHIVQNGAEAVRAVVDAEALIVIVPPSELQNLPALSADKRIKIVAVLQTLPTTFF